MHYVQMTAIKPIFDDFGAVAEGQTFECDNVKAGDFEAAGLAARYRPPSRIKQFLGKMFAPTAPEPVIENKMLVTEQNKRTIVPPGGRFPDPQPPPRPYPDPTPMVAHRGRPAIVRTCEDCGARGTTVEMRGHKCPPVAA